MVSGLMVPGFRRTSPLNIQLSRPLSGVDDAICGSSLPASAEPMPTTSVFFCAYAAGAARRAAPTNAITIVFIVGLSPSCRHCYGGPANMQLPVEPGPVRRKGCAREAVQAECGEIVTRPAAGGEVGAQQPA